MKKSEQIEQLQKENEELKEKLSLNEESFDVFRKEIDNLRHIAETYRDASYIHASKLVDSENEFEDFKRLALSSKETVSNKIGCLKNEIHRLQNQNEG